MKALVFFNLLVFSWRFRLEDLITMWEECGYTVDMSGIVVLDFA